MASGNSQDRLSRRTFLKMAAAATAAPLLGQGRWAGAEEARPMADRAEEMRGRRVPRYGRWHGEFAGGRQVERVEFVGPDGIAQVRPAFAHQPAELHYDDRGYEHVQATGEVVRAARFTPTEDGRYRYRALDARGEVLEEGDFVCEPSDHPGYVELSARDPRYFAYSSGAPYCAIGLNLCWPVWYRLPRGGEHFAVLGASGTLGAAEYRRWFRELSRNGGNFARLWLSTGYFDAQGEVAGELDLRTFAHLDAVVEEARAHGVRLKVCLENFRAFDPELASQSTVLRHPDDGRTPRDMDEWFESEEWQRLWWRRVDAYLARYGDDPTIMAWELWNEINCCVTSDWSVQREWTRRTLPEVKRRAPRNLVTNSIGSFDDPRYQAWYDDFRMEEMDFQQVHRYLDQGPAWEICRWEPAALGADAVRRARRPDRPILLAETGAVNDWHTGPFRYYRADHRGTIFHDVTFAAFFAGAAGTGHIWHWESYVDQKNLWGQFRPFAGLLEGVQLDAEGFEPFDLSDGRRWVLGLKGERHTLLWVRNRADCWHRVLRDEQEPPPLRGERVDLGALGVPAGRVTTLWPWGEGRGEAALSAGQLRLPDFRYGLMVRIAPG